MIFPSKQTRNENNLPLTKYYAPFMYRIRSEQVWSCIINPIQHNYGKRKHRPTKYICRRLVFFAKSSWS